MNHSPPSSARRISAPVIALAALIAGGLVLRVALWHTQPFVSVDGTTYIRLARWLAGGQEFASNQSLGYPLLIAGVAKFLPGDWVRAARWVDFAAGIAILPLTWLLARRVVRNPWLQLAPVALVAFLPLPVRYSLTTMSEAPYVALLLGMFVLVLSERPLLGGIVGGLAYAVRPEALTSVVALAALRARHLRTGIRILAGAALVVAIYVVGQGLSTGSWTLTAKTSNLAAGEWWQNEPTPGEGASPSLAERVERYGEGSVAAYPKRFAALGEQLLRHGGYIVPVLGVVGLFGPGLPLAAGLLQFLVTPVFSLGAHTRFVLPFLPFLWVLAASGLERLRPAALRWGLGILCVAGITATVVRELPGYTYPEDGSFPELVEAGEWLKGVAGPKTIVYDRKPLTAFYAGATYRSIPLGSYEDILDTIVAEGGDYLVVDEAVVDFFRPALLPLVRDKAVAWAEFRLSPVYINPKYEGHMTIIFRVVRPGGPPPLPLEADPRTHRRMLEYLTHQADHFRHGMLYMRGGKMTLASGEFGLAVKQDSTNTDAMNNLAWCLVQQGQYLKWAEENARKAVETEPENLDYLDTLVATLRAEGKTEEADRVAARIDSLRTASGAGGR